MDLIYTDKEHTELGVLSNFYCDFDVADTMDFKMEVGINNNKMKGGYYWFIPDTEFGGRIDKYNVINESNTIEYYGRSVRGLLASKVIEPPKGQDYKIINGNVAEAISGLISDAGYSNMYVVEDSTLVLNNFKLNRYTTLYNGISSMLFICGYVPSFKIDIDGIVHISFSKPVDYSNENEYTVDDFGFTIEKSYANVNHLICLGQGELKDRTVIHLYVDADGNIGDTQYFFGEDEITEVYDYPNAENEDELMASGIQKLNELSNSDSFTVTLMNDKVLKIGDIVGGVERVTDTYVASKITNIIATIKDNSIELAYKVGSDDTSSGNSASSRSSSDVQLYMSDSIQVVTTQVTNVYNTVNEVVEVVEVVAEEVDTLKANMITVDTLAANVANIDTLDANSAFVKFMTTDVINANYIRSLTADIGYLTADSAIISDLQANKLNTSDLNAEVAKLGYLTADSAVITSLQTGKLNASDLNAEVAKLGYLTSSSAVITSLQTDKLDASQLSAEVAKLGYLESNAAALGRLMADSGLIDDLVVTEDAKILGTLKGLTIKGDVIEANTISAKSLIIREDDEHGDYKNGLIYQINATASGLDATELSKEEYREKISGQDLIAQSVTADMIDTDSLGANEAFLNKVFAQDITATGSITGVTLKGSKFIVDSDNISETYVSIRGSDSAGDYFTYMTPSYINIVRGPGSNDIRFHSVIGTSGMEQLYTNKYLDETADSIKRYMNMGFRKYKDEITCVKEGTKKTIYSLETNLDDESTSFSISGDIYENGTALSEKYLGITAKAESAKTADKLSTARTISLTGSVTGSGTFDGSGNLSIATTTNHTHNYAGSSSAGGSATSAVKLDSSAGSSTQPVYFSSGKPVACTYSLGTSVPSGAVFTDTKNTAGTTNTTSKIYLAGATSQAANPQTYSNVNCYASGGYLYSGGTKVSVEGHTHSYLPLSGGTITGNLVVGGTLTGNANIIGNRLYSEDGKTAATTAAPNCYISSDGRYVKSSTTSSRRFKTDIKPVENDELNPESLYDVEVIQFKYKEGHFTNEDDIRYGKDMIGFIAEDIYDKYKIAADYHVDEDSGEVLVDGWNAQYMIPAMLKLIQNQNEQVQELKEQIRELKDK